MSPSADLAKCEKLAKILKIASWRARRFLHTIFDDFDFHFGGQNGFKKLSSLEVFSIFSPRCIQEGPRCVQERPKTPQERPKSGPRAAQERPRAAQSASRVPQERPKSAQERPKSPQRESSAGDWLLSTHSVLSPGGGKIDGFTV